MEATVEEPLDLEAFAHIVAHDLGAPLRGLSIHLRLLERELDGEAAKERIQVLQDRLRQMDAMLRRIRAFSRVHAEAEQAGPTDLAEATRESWERIGPERHRLVLEGAGTTSAPPLLVHAILDELLRNAVEHDDRGEGEVRVRLEGPVVTIEDDGPGLPTDPERLIEPFAKAGSHVDDGRGTGLALVRHVAMRLGGHFDLQSGRGTTATVHLPE